MAVRRLTPRECERLQGFPDDFTLVEYNGRPAKDGPRYRALGNAMAVPVIGWILQRILCAGVAPTGRAADRKSVCCGFNSRPRHHRCGLQRRKTVPYRD